MSEKSENGFNLKNDIASIWNNVNVCLLAMLKAQLNFRNIKRRSLSEAFIIIIIMNFSNACTQS